MSAIPNDPEVIKDKLSGILGEETDSPARAIFLREPTRNPDLSKIFQVLKMPDIHPEDRAAKFIIVTMYQLGMIEPQDGWEEIVGLVGAFHTMLTHTDSRWNDELKGVLYSSTQDYNDSPLIQTIESMYDVDLVHTEVIEEADTLARLLIYHEVAKSQTN